MNKKYLLIFSRKSRNPTYWLVLIAYTAFFTLLDIYLLKMDREKSLLIMLSGLLVIHLCLNYYFLIYHPGKKS